MRGTLRVAPNLLPGIFDEYARALQLRSEEYGSSSEGGTRCLRDDSPIPLPDFLPAGQQGSNASRCLSSQQHSSGFRLTAGAGQGADGQPSEPMRGRRVRESMRLAVPENGWEGGRAG